MRWLTQYCIGCQMRGERQYSIFEGEVEVDGTIQTRWQIRPPYGMPQDVDELLLDEQPRIDIPNKLLYK